MSEKRVRIGAMSARINGRVARMPGRRPGVASVTAAVAGFFVFVMVAVAGGAVHASDESKLEKKKMNIQEVTSPGGIKAWLVEEHSVPLVAMRFAFEGGTAQDPGDKPGVANFLTAMLDEGAGDLEAAAFQERMADLAMRMSFSEGRDTF